MCPPNYASGGPELMHQLANKLEMIGFQSFMFYVPISTNPIHLNYTLYSTKYTTSIDDHQDNVIIIPEVMVPIANAMKELVYIRKCIWWLSIDNFFKPLHNMLGAMRLPRIFNFFEHFYFFLKVTNKSYDYHLVQSNYAADFLTRRKIQAQYLSDYLNQSFIQKSNSFNIEIKENIVLYNPKKGLEFTKKIIKASKGFNWIPIEGLTPKEVVDLLAKSKVYIDFGTHPGKDRFPREAAILNCCVITGRRGSAKFKEDVSLPDLYKIEDSEKNIEFIVSLIESCFSNYQEHLKDFEKYRQKIANEEKDFVLDVCRNFVEVNN